MNVASITPQGDGSYLIRYNDNAPKEDDTAAFCVIL